MITIAGAQTGILIGKNYDPKFKRGEDLYWVTNSKIPNVSKLPKTGIVKGSIELIRCVPDKTLDETLELEWTIAKDGKFTKMAYIFKQLMSINPNIGIDDETRESVWIYPNDLNRMDVYPEQGSIDGLTVVAELKEGTPWGDAGHIPVQCYHFRAPTVEEGHAYAQRLQFYATELDENGKPTGFIPLDKIEEVQ